MHVSLLFAQSVNDAALVGSSGTLVHNRVITAVWIGLDRVDRTCIACCCSRSGGVAEDQQEENENEQNGGGGTAAATASTGLARLCVDAQHRLCRHHGTELVLMVFLPSFFQFNRFRGILRGSGKT